MRKIVLAILLLTGITGYNKLAAQGCVAIRSTGGFCAAGGFWAAGAAMAAVAPASESATARVAADRARSMRTEHSLIVGNARPDLSPNWPNRPTLEKCHELTKHFEQPG